MRICWAILYHTVPYQVTQGHAGPNLSILDHRTIQDYARPNITILDSIGAYGTILVIRDHM